MKCFQSYLSNRCIYVGEDPLNDIVVNSTVLQGLILGPLLFLFYVNDLSRFLNPNFGSSGSCKLCVVKTLPMMTVTLMDWWHL